jgi:hypothetical protein
LPKFMSIGVAGLPADAVIKLTRDTVPPAE